MPAVDVALVVGRVVPLDRSVAAPVMGELTRHVEDSGLATSVAAAVADPRLERPVFDAVWRREVALTTQWAARRLIAARRGQRSAPGWDGAGRVLALVPAHGHAVHVLRRALPFAACGVPTVVAGHAHQAGAVTRVTATLADAFRLGDRLSAAPGPAPDAVGDLRPGDLVVVTGARATPAAVAATTPAVVLGATGQSTVVVGPDAGAVRAVVAALRPLDREGSCTRLHSGWVGEPTARTWVSPDDGRPADPAAVLADAHPSVVYHVGGAAPGELAGFTVLPVDGTGAPATLVGFGRDPAAGWPGDFMA